MKAFLYTIVLTAILVGAIVILRSIESERPARLPTPRHSTKPMVVRSDPAVPSTLDAVDLDTANQAALYGTGMELLDLWHLPEAVDVFETLVRADSTYLDAYVALVRCYSHPMVGQERRAEQCWRRAQLLVQEGRGDSLWVAVVGELFVEGALESAIEKLIEITGAHPDSVDAQLLLAEALLRARRVGDAAIHAESVLERDQSLGQARELLIRCRVLYGDLESAEALARDLAANYPEEPYPYVLLSRVLLMRGEIEDAAEFCNNALLIDDRYIPAIVARAHLYVAEREPVAASVSFEKLLLFDDAMLAAVGNEGIAYVDFLFGAFDDAVDRMDDAIRLAMSAESTRRGLLYAIKLVDYLCELGRPEAAESVLDRWVSRHGPIPAQLAALRVGISEGHQDRARRALNAIQNNDEWRAWMRQLALDFAEIKALTFIEDEDFQRALETLDGQDGEYPGARRPYLKGFAMFRSGDAEGAIEYFAQARVRLNELDFPYHSDPILYVQSLFFLAEAALARGETSEAIERYREFLDHWGGADWELQAVSRARAKLDTLSPESPSG